MDKEDEAEEVSNVPAYLVGWSTEAVVVFVEDLDKPAIDSDTHNCVKDGDRHAKHHNVFIINILNIRFYPTCEVQID